MLATLAMRVRSPPRAPNISRPSMYASFTRRHTAREKRSVMLTLIPWPMSCRIAGIPSGVPGTLIMRLSRRTSLHRRIASSIVAWVSWAR